MDDTKNRPTPLESSQGQGQGHGQKELRGEERRIQPSTSALASCLQGVLLLAYLVAPLIPFFPLSLVRLKNAVVFKLVWMQISYSSTHLLLALFQLHYSNILHY